MRVQVPAITVVSPSKPTASIAPRRHRVLVIDDEPHLRRALGRMLERQHDVTFAESGEAALAHLRNGERFDIILCDLMMPNMTGMDFHKHIRDEWPEHESRLLFMTGGAFSPRSAEFVRDLGRAALDKPLDRASIERAFALVCPPA